jgi:hypothetical protein
MRHWLAALLDLERPDLYQCLPEDFNLGHRLPPGQHPLIRRKGCVPTLLPKPWPWGRPAGAGTSPLGVARFQRCRNAGLT